MRRYDVLGVFLLVTGLAGSAHGQVTLEWKLKPDETFQIVTNSLCEQQLEALGKQAKQQVERSTVLVFKVLEKTNDKTVLEERIDQIGVAPRGENVPNRVGNLLKNAQFKITLNPAMRVVQFDGYQGLIRRLAADDQDVQGQAVATLSAVGPAGLAALPVLAYKSEARRSMEAFLTEEGLQQAVSDLFAFVPGKPVKPGDTWTQESTVSLGPLGSAKRTTVYKYEGTETRAGKNLDKIGFTIKVVFTGAGSSSTLLPFQIIKADLKAEDGKGNIYFDSAAGRLVESDTDLSLQGPLTLDAAGTKYEATMQLHYTIKSLLGQPGAAPAPTAPAASGQRGP
jgi:hypothetical protein